MTWFKRLRGVRSAKFGDDARALPEVHGVDVAGLDDDTVAGALCDAQGDLRGAEAAYRRADERGDAAAACCLGTVLERRGDLPDAEAAYRRADERGDATGACNLGRLLHERGELHDAEAALRRADARGHPGAARHLALLMHERWGRPGAGPRTGR